MNFPPEKVLVFEVSGQSFAVDVQHVREVLRPPPVSPVPRARPPVRGVFNLRGHVVTAVDGADALGLEAPEPPHARAVVAEADGRLLGLLVDAAVEVRAVTPEDVRDTRHAGELPESVVRGVVLLDERPVVLVDVQNLLPSATGAPRPTRPGRANP